MATIFQTLNLVKKWHYLSLSRYEKIAISSILGGVEGLGDVSDIDVKDYLSDKQIAFVRRVGKRYLITSKTKI